MEVEKMVKKYRYKGYEFFRTDITTDKTYKVADRDFYKTKRVYVYQVSGFGPMRQLTSIKACKDFIDELEEKRRWYN